MSFSMVNLLHIHSTISVNSLTSTKYLVSRSKSELLKLHIKKRLVIVQCCNCGICSCQDNVPLEIETNTAQAYIIHLGHSAVQTTSLA